MEYLIENCKTNTVQFDRIELESFLEWYEGTDGYTEIIRRWSNNPNYAIARLVRDLKNKERKMILTNAESFDFDFYKFFRVENLT